MHFDDTSSYADDNNSFFPEESADDSQIFRVCLKSLLVLCAGYH